MNSQAIILLSTCHLHLDGVDDLMRLVETVSASLRNREVAQIHHLVLLQGSSESERRAVHQRLPHWVTLLASDARLSSPEARNRLIDHLLADENFDPEAIVGFPDDDAWYPPGALGAIAGHFARDETLQLLLARYGPHPSIADVGTIDQPTLQQALSRGACASIIVRARLLAQLGGFHPLLGLGTEISGGEDTEFVHRAYHLAKGHIVIPAGTLVGHEAAEPAKKIRYFEGGLAAIAAHSRASPAARRALIRKLFVGVAAVSTGRMRSRDFVRAVKKARKNASAIRESRSTERERKLTAGFGH